MYDLSINHYVDKCPLCDTAMHIHIEDVCGTFQVYCDRCDTATSIDVKYRLICDAVDDWNARNVLIWDETIEEYVDYKPLMKE